MSNLIPPQSTSDLQSDDDGEYQPPEDAPVAKQQEVFPPPVLQPVPTVVEKPPFSTTPVKSVATLKRTGRRKIPIEFIDDKSRRHITFSKRKAGIMKKAYELSTLTGTQVLLLVASETGHVYTFATPKLQPLITKPEGKNLIQACLNAPDTLGHNLENSANNPANGSFGQEQQQQQQQQQQSSMTMPQTDYGQQSPAPSGYSHPSSNQIPPDDKSLIQYGMNRPSPYTDTKPFPIHHGNHGNHGGVNGQDQTGHDSMNGYGYSSPSMTPNHPMNSRMYQNGGSLPNITGGGPAPFPGYSNNPYAMGSPMNHNASMMNHNARLGGMGNTMNHNGNQMNHPGGMNPQHGHGGMKSMHNQSPQGSMNPQEGMNQPGMNLNRIGGMTPQNIPPAFSGGRVNPEPMNMEGNSMNHGRMNEKLNQEGMTLMRSANTVNSGTPMNPAGPNMKSGMKPMSHGMNNMGGGGGGGNMVQINGGHSQMGNNMPHQATTLSPMNSGTFGNGTFPPNTTSFTRASNLPAINSNEKEM